MRPRTKLSAAESCDGQAAWLTARARSHRREVWCDTLGMEEVVGWGYTLRDGLWTLAVEPSFSFTVTLINANQPAGERAPVYEQELSEVEAFELVAYLLDRPEVLA